MPRLETAIFTLSKVDCATTSPCQAEAIARTRKIILSFMTRQILTIKTIDEAALVYAPQNRVVDQILGFDGFRLWDGAFDVAQNCLDALLQRIGLARLYLLDNHLIGFLGFIPVLELHEIHNEPYAFFFVLFRKGDSFEKTSHELFHHGAPVAQEWAGRGDTAAVKFEAELVGVNDGPKAGFSRPHRIRRCKDRGLNRIRFHCRHPAWIVADLHNRNVALR